MRGFPSGLVVKNLPAMQETWVRSLVWEDPRFGKIPWRRAWQPTPLLLPRESHRQRSLVGYSLEGHKESDITLKQLCMHNSYWSCLNGILLI